MISLRASQSIVTLTYVIQSRQPPMINEPQMIKQLIYLNTPFYIFLFEPLFKQGVTIETRVSFTRKPAYAVHKTKSNQNYILM